MSLGSIRGTKGTPPFRVSQMSLWTVSRIGGSDLNTKAKPTRTAKARQPDLAGSPDVEGRELTGLAASINDKRIQSALMDHDREMHEVEKTWGVDRLPYLVSDDMRLKFWKAQEQLNEAIRANDGDRVADRAANVRRGLEMLVKAAEKAAECPLATEVWECAMPGGTGVLRLVRAFPEHSARLEPRDGVVTWTLEEVARVLEGMELVNVVKDQIPGAYVHAVTRKIDTTQGEPNDDIPF